MTLRNVGTYLIMQFIFIYILKFVIIYIFCRRLIRIYISKMFFDDLKHKSFCFQKSIWRSPKKKSTKLPTMRPISWMLLYWNWDDCFWWKICWIPSNLDYLCGSWLTLVAGLMPWLWSSCLGLDSFRFPRYYYFISRFKNPLWFHVKTSNNMYHFEILIWRKI